MPNRSRNGEVSSPARVVAPTSVLHGWMREIDHFRPELRYSLYHGTGRKLDPEADVTITSYALLRQDVELLTAQTWDCVVLDEAQMIKNPESQIARAALRLDAKARFALTGTPVENRLDELWSQLHFLNPGLLGAWGGAWWLGRFCVGGAGAATVGAAALLAVGPVAAFFGAVGAD